METILYNLDGLTPLIMALITITIIVISNTENKQKTPQENNQNQKLYPYKKRSLLTETEYNFYKTLKEECDKRNFLICPKVRMEDFLIVTDYEQEAKYRGYIKSRHIDFIICDQELKMLCGIELDDYSHYSYKAQKTDKLKNDIFKTIDIPLYRITVGHGSYKEQLEAAFYVMKKRNEELDQKSSCLENKKE